MTSDQSHHSNDTRQRLALVLIHCAVVLLVFVMPDLIITYLQPQRPAAFYIGVYTRTVGVISVFYINYLWLIPQLLSRQRRRVWLYVCVNILLVALFLTLMYVLMTHMPHHYRHPGHGRPMSDDSWRFLVKRLPVLARDFISVILAIGLSITLKLTEAWTKLERKNEEILAAQRTEEISNLRSQLNPHSIFNILNTIYALIDIDTEQAKEAVHRLSKLLRYMLYENPSAVELSKEAEFIRSYVALMEMRLGHGRVSLDIDINGGDSSKVAPLLFLPVIENAFKHSRGVSTERRICISLTARDGTIVCSAHNPCDPNCDTTSPGIGLENLRRRLRLLYGDEASLTITEQNGLFTSTVCVPDTINFN